MKWGGTTARRTYMKALKSTLAKAALADPIAREQIRNYVVTRSPVVIELQAKHYRLEVYRKP